MNTHSLKNAFLTNSVSDFFFRNSEKVTSYLWTAGNTTLLLKPVIDELKNAGISSVDGVVQAVQNGLHPTFEAGAGLMFLGTSLILRLSKEHPVLAFRLAGACSILGSLCLSASGIDFDTQQVVDMTKVVSPLIGLAPSGVMMAFQHEIAEGAKRFSESKNILKRGFAKVAEHPVVVSGLMILGGDAGMFKSAVSAAQPDVVLGGIAAAWIVGAFGYMASDPRAQEAYHAAKAEKHEL